MLGEPPTGGRLRLLAAAGFFEVQETTTKEESEISQRHMVEC